jgi:hypothetical protein
MEHANHRIFNTPKIQPIGGMFPGRLAKFLCWFLYKRTCRSEFDGIGHTISSWGFPSYHKDSSTAGRVLYGIKRRNGYQCVPTISNAGARRGIETGKKFFPKIEKKEGKADIYSSSHFPLLFFAIRFTFQAVPAQKISTNDHSNETIKPYQLQVHEQLIKHQNRPLHS